MLYRDRLPVPGRRPPGATQRRCRQAELFIYSHQFHKTGIGISKEDLFSGTFYAINIEELAFRSCYKFISVRSGNVC
jgi:hypothetical protein